MYLLLPVKVLNCGVYHPWRYRGEHNPYRDATTKTMMNFKEPSDRRHAQAVKELAALVMRKLPSITVKINNRSVYLVSLPFTIAVVPSSKAGVHSEGLMRIASMIAESYPNAHVNPLLHRVHSVPSAHKENGERSIYTHMQSIQVQGFDPHRERHILILDDVTTTGSSLSACYYLLKDVGADAVVPLSILETASY
ncbi:hypothetical protein [Aeromonas veronii]|uniref:hypothetical protein n=1 Tax=Aeromonas veronii TaxID=654 RepID=UPI001E380BC0|nr:hypothetical protein [Aeromonas veronii]